MPSFLGNREGGLGNREGVPWARILNKQNRPFVFAVYYLWFPQT